MFFNEPLQTTLIVVCKNELLTNQLKKYVETNDDIDEENVVGTKDGTVKIVAWDEKVWLDNKKAGNIASKILLIGNVKGADKLLPIIDIKYNEFGIKYGLAGNQALITANPTIFSDHDIYGKFVDCIKKYDLADNLKPVEPLKDNKEVSPKEELPEKVMPETTGEAKKEETDVADSTKPKKKIGFAKAIGKTISFIGKAASTISSGVSHTVSQISSAIDDLPADRLELVTQQYYLGIMKFYENHLSEFLR